MDAEDFVSASDIDIVDCSSMHNRDTYGCPNVPRCSNCFLPFATLLNCSAYFPTPKVNLVGMTASAIQIAKTLFALETACAAKDVAKIDAALQRIEDGTYGYCEETDEPIGLKRLEARPIATLSIEAQERHERLERTYRDD